MAQLAVSQGSDVGPRPSVVACGGDDSHFLLGPPKHFESSDVRVLFAIGLLGAVIE